MVHVLAKDLREAVLQAAFEGKLTKRDKADSSVREFLRQNSTKRSLLESKKEIKKDKIVQIKYDEVPFEIPETWEWVRLNELYSVLNGDRGKNYPSKSKLSKTGNIPFISALNLNGKNVNVDDNLLYLDEQQYNSLNAGKLKKNDIVMCIRGSLGKHGVFQFDKGAIASSLAIIRPISCGVNTRYLFYYLESELLQSEIRKYDNGTAQPNLSADNLKKFLFPLPPIEEQDRIVTKVDELMAKIDEYEKLEKELTELKEKFPEDMKAAVLQAAFSGKLTSFLSGDSDIETALKELNIIKSDFVKKKLIKKEQPLEALVEEEIPYDIPENWRWMKIGDLIDCGSGSTPLKGHPEYYINGTIPWLKTGELTNTYITACEEKITKEAFKKGSFRVNKPGDILIAMYGATIGKLGICTFETTTNQACLGCTPFSILDNMYLFYYFKAAKDALVGKAEGGAQPNISRIKVRNHPIPIPPIEEQQRIVDKLDKLLPMCDELVNLC